MLQKIMSIKFMNKHFYGRIKLRNTSLETYRRVADKPSYYKQSDYFANPHKQPTKVFYKKGVLKSFAKFTGKHLYRHLFCSKFAGPGQQLY